MRKLLTVATGAAVTLAAVVAVVSVVAAEPCPVAVEVTAMAPTTGFASGGTEVTMTGTNFDVCGIDRISFGDADGDDIQIVAADGEPDRVTVRTPPGTGSVVPVLHYGEDQSANAPDFEYQIVPTLDRMLPPEGPASGGTDLAIWGSDFILDGATTQIRIGDVMVTPTILTDDYIEARTPATDASTVDVGVVITLAAGEEGASGSSPYTYVPPPSPESIDLTDGRAHGGDVVLVTGENFQRGARVFFGMADGSAPADEPTSRFDGSNSSSAVEFVDAEHLRVMTPAGSPGVVNILVLNPDGQTGVLLDAFTYAGRAPAIDSIAPASGPSLGGTTVTITGSDFAPGASVRFGVGDTASVATDVVVVSAETITAVAPALLPAQGIVVSVVNPDAGRGSIADAFTAVASAAPTLASVAPQDGTSTGGTFVTLFGSGFANGAVVRIDGAADDVGAAVIDAGRLRFTTPPHPAGTVDLVVVNPDGQTSSPVTFSFEAAAAPTISSVNPAVGPTSGGSLVTIAGSGFAAGAQVSIGGVDVTAEISDEGRVLALVRNASTIVAVTPPGVAGPVDVEVVNPDGSSVTATGAFTFQGPPAAVLNEITPAVGSSVGGQRVILSGENFAPGSVVTFGNGDCSSSLTPACNLRAVDVVVGPNQIEATTPAGLFGYQNVSVVGPDGSVRVLRYGFDFGAGADAPTIDAVTPPVGASGSTLTITGTGYVEGGQAFIGNRRLEEVVVTDDDGSTSVPVVRDGETIEGLVPRRSGGTFPVAVSNPDGQAAIEIDGFSYPVDTTAPTTTATATTGQPATAHVLGATNWARGPVTVQLTATDGVGGSGVDVIRYSAGGAQVIAETTATGSPTSFLVTAEGSTTVEFWATDLAGVAEQPVTRVVAIDSIGPALTASSTFVPGTQTNQDVDVEFNCSDAGGSGVVAPVTFSTTSQVTTSGTNPLTVTFTDPGIGQSVTASCTDVAGNTSTKAFSGVNITTQGPELTAVATTADGATYQAGTWTNLNVVVTFVCRPPATVGPLHAPQIASVTPPTLIDTSVTLATVEGECRDAAGNSATASFSKISVDKTLPRATVTATSGGAPYVAGTWTRFPVVLTFACTDDGANQSGVASVSEPLTISRDGTTAGASGTCTDRAGNRADPAVFLGPILIDAVAPSCSLIVMPSPLAPANGKMVAVSATVVASDDRAGIGQITLESVTTNRPATAGSDIAGFVTGTDDRTGSLRAAKGNEYVLTYRVSDVAGNASQPCAATVGVR